MLSRRQVIKSTAIATLASLTPTIPNLALPVIKNAPVKTPLVTLVPKVCQYLDLFLHDEPHPRLLLEFAEITNRIKSTLSRFGFTYNDKSTDTGRQRASGYFLAAATKENWFFCMAVDYWIIMRNDSGILPHPNDGLYYQRLAGTAEIHTWSKYGLGAPDDADIIEKCTYSNAMERFYIVPHRTKTFHWPTWIDYFNTRTVLEMQKQGIDLHKVYQFQKTANPKDHLYVTTKTGMEMVVYCVDPMVDDYENLLLRRDSYRI